MGFVSIFSTLYRSHFVVVVFVVCFVFIRIFFPSFIYFSFFIIHFSHSLSFSFVHYHFIVCFFFLAFVVLPSGLIIYCTLSLQIPSHFCFVCVCVCSLLLRRHSTVLNSHFRCYYFHLSFVPYPFWFNVAVAFVCMCECFIRVLVSLVVILHLCNVWLLFDSHTSSGNDFFSLCFFVCSGKLLRCCRWIQMWAMENDQAACVGPRKFLAILG